ncbi:hypothetical protein BDV59DRAFT_203951 [Aspergillus ambiguus]|uniref:uncharacterized protein n=1 Tax=Aspergillus ambiguus TaxID=176160 RepID=UPI003CCCCB5C
MDRLTKGFCTLTLQGRNLFKRRRQEQGDTQGEDSNRPRLQQREGSPAEDSKAVDAQKALENLGRIWDVAQYYHIQNMGLMLLGRLGVHVEDLFINSDGTYEDTEAQVFFLPGQAEETGPEHEDSSDSDSMKGLEFDPTARDNEGNPGKIRPQGNFEWRTLDFALELSMTSFDDLPLMMAELDPAAFPSLPSVPMTDYWTSLTATAPARL